LGGNQGFEGGNQSQGGYDGSQGFGGRCKCYTADSLFFFVLTSFSAGGGQSYGNQQGGGGNTGHGRTGYGSSGSGVERFDSDHRELRVFDLVD